MHCSFEGWQPGIQEDAAEWDDDWDKFEDEGELEKAKMFEKKISCPWYVS